MEAIGNYLVVRERKEPKKKSGLMIPSHLQKEIRYILAETVKVGNDIDFLKEGDEIYFDRNQGHLIKFEGEILRVIQARDVVIKL